MNLFRILCLLLGLASCAAPRAAVPLERKAPLPPAAARVMQSLTQQRARFLTTGDPDDVFAVFYYHVTDEILRRVHAGSVLEMLVDFHAAWERNRDPLRREPHWQAYYARAAQLLRHGLTWSGIAQPMDVLHPRGLLALGIAAHIDHDLPRTLTTVLYRHPELRGTRLAEQEAAFRSLDEIFDDCTARGFHDIATRIAHPPGPRAIVRQSRIARAIITRKRHRAWQQAVR